MIEGSALRHRCTVADINYALDNALFWFDMDDFDMYVGPVANGALTEVGANREGEVFHAMDAQPKFLGQR